MDARGLIEEARDAHPSFTRERHPDAILLRALSRYQRDLAARVIERHRQALDTVETIELPLADFDAGHVLPARHAVHGGTVVGDDGGTADFEVIAWQLRHRAPRWSGWILDERLYLAGSARDWERIDRVELRYTPLVEDLTRQADEITLPDPARRALVTFLEATMAKRARQEDGVDRAILLEEHAAAEIRYLDEVTFARGVSVSTTREVW